ncbi:kinase-like domain-containing protein [Halteromyces radiatus]|uniref:kinase-like domain-containing protein n=1 Tax=Halteromyces radiatus TaxID=101107 RepID=UPI002220D8DE|nr:kinase-like domain-containing protein [Halteromyces radiatus]KAI8086720.1 kinase-like domain-containing protein [Halteromyces radiatus]
MYQSIQIEDEGTSVAFRIDTRYRIIRNIGSGSTGIVCSAYDQQTNTYCAIKKIRQVMGPLVSSTLRNLREIECLHHFRGHPRIVELLDVYLLDLELYLIFRCMDATLHDVIYSNQSLDIIHAQWFMYQLFSGLHYIHSSGVIHRDLKPANILVNKNGHIRIADFGMARQYSIHQKQPSYFTEYICTRWYRAPEVMIGDGQYDELVDVWSLGCIFGEILGRKVLFPGKDYMDQLYMILLHCGLPTIEKEGTSFWQSSSFVMKRLHEIYLHRHNKNINDDQIKVIDFESMFPHCPSDGIQLLRALLQWHPQHRISITHAFHHPFVISFSDPKEEALVCPPWSIDHKEDLDQLKLNSLLIQRINEFQNSST